SVLLWLFVFSVWCFIFFFFFFSSRRRHTRSKRDWSSDVCSSDLDPRLDPPVEGERVAGLLDWRIEPRVSVETGIDFRDYPGLSFRARRRMVIHYARVAGRGSIPTLRLIALDPKREPSLRARLAAAEPPAGPSL